MPKGIVPQILHDLDRTQVVRRVAAGSEQDLTIQILKQSNCSQCWKSNGIGVRLDVLKGCIVVSTDIVDQYSHLIIGISFLFHIFRLPLFIDSFVVNCLVYKPLRVARLVDDLLEVDTLEEHIVYHSM